MEISYVELVFPADFHGATASVSDDGGGVQYHLIPEFLEKGVIRMARIQSLFVPRADDEKLAEQAQELFAAAAPPLTT